MFPKVITLDLKTCGAVIKDCVYSDTFGLNIFDRLPTVEKTTTSIPLEKSPEAHHIIKQEF